MQLLRQGSMLQEDLSLRLPGDSWYLGRQDGQHTRSHVKAGCLLWSVVFHCMAEQTDNTVMHYRPKWIQSPCHGSFVGMPRHVTVEVLGNSVRASLLMWYVDNTKSVLFTLLLLFSLMIVFVTQKTHNYCLHQNVFFPYKMSKNSGKYCAKSTYCVLAAK